MGMMVIFIQILIGLLLLYGGGCLWIYFLQENRIFRPDKLHPKVDLGLAPPHQERWFQVEEGVFLNAAHLKVEAPKGVILYHHGNAGDLTEWKKVASLLLPYGFDVLVYDYRGYGKSEGRIRNEEQLFKDGQHIYNQIKVEYGEEHLLLYGRSLGTSIASHLAAKNAPKGLLLETPFYSMQDLVRRYYPWLPHSLLLRYPLRNDLHLERVDCPIFIFHGDQDEIIEHRSALKLKDFLKPNDRFYTIPDAHHADLSEFPSYHKALKEALDAMSISEDQAGKVRSAS